MISAKEARRISDRVRNGNIDAEVQRIEQAIRQAAAMGRTEISVYDGLRYEVRKMLTDAGFRVGLTQAEYGYSNYTIGWENAE